MKKCKFEEARQFVLGLKEYNEAKDGKEIKGVAWAGSMMEARRKGDLYGTGWELRRFKNMVFIMNGHTANRLAFRNYAARMD